MKHDAQWIKQGCITFPPLVAGLHGDCQLGQARRWGGPSTTRGGGTGNLLGTAASGAATGRAPRRLPCFPCFVFCFLVIRKDTKKKGHVVSPTGPLLLVPPGAAGGVLPDGLQ